MKYDWMYDLAVLIAWVISLILAINWPVPYNFYMTLALVLGMIVTLARMYFRRRRVE